jgi:hypothetical protein
LISGTGLWPVKSHRLEACATRLGGQCSPSLEVIAAGSARPTKSKLKRIASPERKNLLPKINIYVNMLT